MPSLVKIMECDLPRSSSDIPYLEPCKEEWNTANFDGIKKTWLKGCCAL